MATMEIISFQPASTFLYRQPVIAMNLLSYRDNDVPYIDS